MLPRCTKIPKLSLTSHEKSISLLTLVNNFHHKKTSICRLNISRVETLAASMICKILTPFVCPEFHAVKARLRKLIRYLLHVNQVAQCWEICTNSSTEAEGYSELLWSNICRAVRPSFINFHNMNWFQKVLKGIRCGVVACGARGLWLRYGSKIAKAT